MNNNAHKPIHPTGHSQSGTGLTKREYFAAMAMQGLCAGISGENIGVDNGESLAKTAVLVSDELLKQLEQKAQS